MRTKSGKATSKLLPKFQAFLREREYISNVTSSTLDWHAQSLKWLHTVANPEQPTADDIKELIVRMRQSGLKASSVNCRLRSIQAYIRWSGSGVVCPRLKEEQSVLPSFSADDIQRFCHWKPCTIFEHRLQVLILLLADTGVRVSEALHLRWSDIDLNNLLLTVMGKGRKSRTIPFSPALRKYLLRFEQRQQAGLRPRYDSLAGSLAGFVFCTRTGNALGCRTVNRDLHRLCEKLSIAQPKRIVHALRHSYALGALRAGASTMHVQRMLGHSSVTQTQRYCQLLTEDLQACAARIGSLIR
jgi:integrase/recombinase XerD